MKVSPTRDEIRQAEWLAWKHHAHLELGSELFWSLYRRLHLAGRSWGRLGFGDTLATTLLALHHQKHPHSREWRPGRVIKEVLS